jgi:hypothetical protein
VASGNPGAGRRDITARYTLRALLDKLDELLNTNPGHE